MGAGSCENTGDVFWKPMASWDLISVNGSSTASGTDPLNVVFTKKGQESQGWTRGKMWGLHFYMTGYDKGFTFSIWLKIEAPVSVPIGPNLVLHPPNLSPNLQRPQTLGQGPLPGLRHL